MADILPYLIIFKSPQEFSAAPIPRNFDVNLLGSPISIFSYSSSSLSDELHTCLENDPDTGNNSSFSILEDDLFMEVFFIW